MCRNSNAKYANLNKYSNLNICTPRAPTLPMTGGPMTRMAGSASPRLSVPARRLRERGGLCRRCAARRTRYSTPTRDWPGPRGPLTLAPTTRALMARVEAPTKAPTKLKRGTDQDQTQTTHRPKVWSVPRHSLAPGPGPGGQRTFA